jgi:hypothetical protein
MGGGVTSFEFKLKIMDHVTLGPHTLVTVDTDRLDSSADGRHRSKPPVAPAQPLRAVRSRSRYRSVGSTNDYWNQPKRALKNSLLKLLFGSPRKI